jgi:hypothetical protein
VGSGEAVICCSRRSEQPLLHSLEVHRLRREIIDGNRPGKVWMIDMFDTILCISLFGVNARWKGIERLASLQDGKKGKHGIVLLFLLSFCDISPFYFVYLFFLRWTIFTFFGGA